MIPRPFDRVDLLRQVSKTLLIAGVEVACGQVVKAARAYCGAKRTAILGRRVLIALLSNRAYGGSLSPVLIAELRIILEERLRWSNRLNDDLFRSTQPVNDGVDGFEVAVAL